MILLLIYLGILLLGLVSYSSFKKTADKHGLYGKFLSFTLVVTFCYAWLQYLPEYAFVLYLLIALTASYEILRACLRPDMGYRLPAIAVVLLFLFVCTGFVPGFPHSRLFLCVLSFDAFSQFFGQIFGKHSLCRKISPNKTLEGSAGGLTVCMLTAFFTFGSAWKGLYIACFALCGDLLASFVKRRSGLKDFSNLLPGQGGMLDRFDSYILSSIFYLPLL